MGKLKQHKPTWVKVGSIDNPATNPLGLIAGVPMEATAATADRPLLLKLTALTPLARRVAQYIHCCRRHGHFEEAR